MRIDAVKKCPQCGHVLAQPDLHSWAEFFDCIHGRGMPACDFVYTLSVFPEPHETRPNRFKDD